MSVETRWPGLREAVEYNLALALVYERRRLDRAYELAHRLALSVLAEAKARPKRKAKLMPHEEARAQRLAAAELPSLMLFAGVLVRRYPVQRKRFDAEQPSRPRPIAADELVEYLERRPTGPPRSNLAFDVVERYVCWQPLLTTRTHYNLACFYTTVEKHERALRELDLALADAGLLPWALKDPSLRPLEETDPEQWREVIERHQPEPPPKEEEPEVEVETLDSWRAAQAVVIAELGSPRDVRAAADVAYEVDTDRGVVLVAFEGGDAATEERVMSLVAAAYRRRRAEAELAGTVLVLGADTTSSLELRETAQAFDVRLLKLREWPMPEPL